MLTIMAKRKKTSRKKVSTTRMVTRLSRKITMSVMKRKTKKRIMSVARLMRREMKSRWMWLTEVMRRKVKRRRV